MKSTQGVRQFKISAVLLCILHACVPGNMPAILTLVTSNCSGTLTVHDDFRRDYAENLNNIPTHKSCNVSAQQLLIHACILIRRRI